MKKLFVGNLPYSANETEVQTFFADHGVTIDPVTVMRDRFTGQARGFGFVEINDDDAAQKAVDNCHGKDLMGRTVVVNEARPMTDRPARGGAGLGVVAAGVSNRTAQSVEQFWRAYFAAVGAQLEEYRPVLLGF